MKIQIADHIKNIEGSATDEIDNIVKRMRRSGINDIINFGGGEPCFDTPANVKAATIKALENGRTKYEPTTGDPDLRDALVEKFKTHNNLITTPDNIVVTPGGKFSLYLIFQTLLNPGDKVMLLEPAWVSYASMAALSRAEVVSIPSSAANGFQPDLDMIRSKMDSKVKFIVVNSPNNPTGAVYSADTIREIAKIALANNVLVISDEIYEDVLYEGERYSPGSEFENIITCNGYSKSFAMTGWRLGYLNAPKEIVDQMIKIYQHSASCVVAFTQDGAIEALRNPKSWEAQRMMTKGYSELCDVINAEIQKSKIFTMEKPKGAFYAFPAINSELNSFEFSQALLEKAHVATVPGSAFGACGEGYIRFSYSVAKEDIVEAFQRINALF